MMLKRDSRFLIAACAAVTLAACPAFAGPGGPGGPPPPPPPPPGGGQGGTITALSVDDLVGAFTLAAPTKTTVNDFVTMTKYTGTGTITVGSAATLSGDVAITTTTTAAAGNGVIAGDLVFTATDKTVLSAHLEGLVGDQGGQILLEGCIGIPPAPPAAGTTPPTTPPAPPAQVAGYLTSDGTTLTGYVATATVTAPTKPTGTTKAKPKGK